MRAIAALSLLALPVLAAACGPSAAMVRDARRSVYDAPFPTVWNVVTEEVRRKYPVIRQEDAIRGEVNTEWRVIEVMDGEGQTGSGASQFDANRTGRTSPGQVANLVTPAKLFRVMVVVRGLSRTGPWRVSIDGEAAEYSPGMAVLTPFKHGLPDEPTWVPTRIDALVVAIHKRLQKHARNDEIPRSAIAKKVHDDTPWAHLPDRAVVAVIGKVHQAAAAKDTSLLRSNMSDAFEFAAGAEGSAETALALWAADPTKMKALAHALEDGCGAEEGSGEVVCPAKADAPAQARFRKVEGDWKFVSFLQ